MTPSGVRSSWENVLILWAWLAAWLGFVVAVVWQPVAVVEIVVPIEFEDLLCQVVGYGGPRSAIPLRPRAATQRFARGQLVIR